MTTKKDCPFEECNEKSEPDIKEVLAVNFDPEPVKLTYTVLLENDEEVSVWMDKIVKKTNETLISAFNKEHKDEHSEKVKQLQEALLKKKDFRRDLTLTSDYAYFDGEERLFVARKIDGMHWDNKKKDIVFKIYWKGYGDKETSDGTFNKSMSAFHPVSKEYEANHPDVVEKARKKQKEYYAKMFKTSGNPKKVEKKGKDSNDKKDAEDIPPTKQAVKGTPKEMSSGTGSSTSPAVKKAKKRDTGNDENLPQSKKKRIETSPPVARDDQHRGFENSSTSSYTKNQEKIMKNFHKNNNGPQTQKSGDLQMDRTSYINTDMMVKVKEPSVEKPKDVARKLPEAPISQFPLDTLLPSTFKIPKKTSPSLRVPFDDVSVTKKAREEGPKTPEPIVVVPRTPEPTIVSLHTREDVREFLIRKLGDKAVMGANSLPFAFLAVQVGDLKIFEKVIKIMKGKIFEMIHGFSLLDHAFIESSKEIASFLLEHGVILYNRYNPGLCENPNGHRLVDVSKRQLRDMVRARVHASEWYRQQVEFTEGPLFTGPSGDVLEYSFNWREGEHQDKDFAVFEVKWCSKKNEFEFTEKKPKVRSFSFNGVDMEKTTTVFLENGIRFCLKRQPGVDQYHFRLNAGAGTENAFLVVMAYKRHMTRRRTPK